MAWSTKTSVGLNSKQASSVQQIHIPAPYLQLVPSPSFLLGQEEEVEDCAFADNDMMDGSAETVTFDCKFALTERLNLVTPSLFYDKMRSKSKVKFLKKVLACTNTSIQSMEILHPTQQLLIYVSVPQKEPSIKLHKGLTRCTKILMLAWTLIWITLWQADQEGEINRPDIHKNEPKSVFVSVQSWIDQEGELWRLSSKVLLEIKYCMASFMVAECVLVDYYNMPK